MPLFEVQLTQLVRFKHTIMLKADSAEVLQKHLPLTLASGPVPGLIPSEIDDFEGALERALECPDSGEEAGIDRIYVDAIECRLQDYTVHGIVAFDVDVAVRLKAFSPHDAEEKVAIAINGGNGPDAPHIEAAVKEQTTGLSLSDAVDWSIEYTEEG